MERAVPYCLPAGVLEDEGLVEPAELAALKAEVAAVVEDARQFAENSPWPESASATRFTYDESPRTEPAIEGNSQPDGPMREISFMQATLEALGEEMARDPRIFVMGEGIGKRGGTSGRPPGCSIGTGRSGFATRPSASEGSWA